MRRLAVALTLALLAPAAAQAGIGTAITKAPPPVQSVGVAPRFPIVFTHPEAQPCTCDDPAEEWPGNGGGDDPPQDWPGNDDDNWDDAPTGGTDEPSSGGGGRP